MLNQSRRCRYNRGSNTRILWRMLGYTWKIFRRLVLLLCSIWRRYNWSHVRKDFSQKVMHGPYHLCTDMLYPVYESMFIYRTRGCIAYLKRYGRSTRRLWTPGAGPSAWIWPRGCENVCNFVWCFPICVKLYSIVRCLVSLSVRCGITGAELFHITFRRLLDVFRTFPSLFCAAGDVFAIC